MCAWWTGQPGYGSNAVSKFVRENFAYLKTLVDAHQVTLSAITADAAEINTLDGSGITNADLVKLHAITASAAEINAAVDAVVHRASIVTITNGGGANTIKVTMASSYNGDAFGITADIARGATVSGVTLQAVNGYYFDIAASLITGDCIGIMSCCPVTGVPWSTGSNDVYGLEATVVAGGIRISATAGSGSTSVDAMMDVTGNVSSIKLLIHYVTNA